MFKDSIKESYDLQSSFYANRRLMQDGNLKFLLKYFFDHEKQLKSERCLDVGCGSGILAKVLHDLAIKHNCKISYYGLDISQEQIKIANQKYSHLGSFYLKDAEKMTFENNFFGYVFSNSVIHWLNVPEENQTCEKVFTKIYNVLKMDGTAALSIVAKGTAKRFQVAYQKIFSSLDESYFIDKSLFRYEPFGAMALDDVVDLLQKVGFEIICAKLNYEPLTYAKSIDYAKDAKALGYNAYLSSIKDIYKDEVWKSIEQCFIKRVGESDYLHDQYMIYVIAKKPFQSI